MQTLIIPCLPKPLPEGQGCGLRAEVHLEGFEVSLTSAQHEGDHQGNEEQDTGAGQGDPDEDVTEGIQIVQHCSPCRNREDGMSTTFMASVTDSSGVAIFLGTRGRICGQKFSKSSPSPQGSALPPHVPGVPRHAHTFYVIFSLSYVE